MLPPAADRDGLRDLLMQPSPGRLPCANPGQGRPTPPQCWHLSSAQLDCVIRLLEVGVPYPAALRPPAPEGLLAFTLSQTVGTGKPSGSDKPDMEEHLALMYDRLRDELPNFLRKSVNSSLYRQDVEFVSNALHMHFRGLVKYRLLLTVSRLLLLSCFFNARLSVLKLTSHPENHTIQARWSFSGLPLHAAILYVFRSEKSDLYRTYDAFSTFQLAPDGLICLHKVERVMPSPPITVPKKTILAAALLALGLGENRPALNLLSSPKMPHEL